MARRYAATDEVSVSDDLSTTGSAGGNVRFLPRRWSSMGKGEIACVRYVRKAFPLRGRWPEGPDEVATRGKLA